MIAEELGGTNEWRNKEASGGVEILQEGEETTEKGVGSTEGECCIDAYDCVILSHLVCYGMVDCLEHRCKNNLQNDHKYYSHRLFDMTLPEEV